MTAPSGGPPGLELEKLEVPFGGSPGLAPLTLELAPGERLALVGPSGAGKSTLLRAVAGLAPVAGGRLRAAGRDVSRVTAEQRGIVYVHQTPLLFPHLTVEQNVAFPLRVRGVPQAERSARVAEALGAVRLDGLGRRMPHTLSGGQRQRAALARGIVARPAVLLLDEPLTGLDPVLRAEVRAAVLALHAEYRPAMVAATHDLDDAGLLGDRVGVLLERTLAQVAAPAELFTRPATLAVARFLGFPNELPAFVEHGVARCALGTTPVRHGTVGGRAILVCRPDAVRLAPDGYDNAVPAVVAEMRHGPLRSTARVRVAGLETPLELLVDPAAALTAGRAVRVRLEPSMVSVFPAP